MMLAAQRKRKAHGSCLWATTLSFWDSLEATVALGLVSRPTTVEGTNQEEQLQRPKGQQASVMSGQQCLGGPLGLRPGPMSSGLVRSSVPATKAARVLMASLGPELKHNPPNLPPLGQAASYPGPAQAASGPWRGGWQHPCNLHCLSYSTPKPFPKTTELCRCPTARSFNPRRQDRF